MDKQIYILGIGHNTPVFMDLALDCGYHIAGLYHYNDERMGEINYGYKVLGSFNDLFQQEVCQKNFLLTMGDIQIRKILCEQLLKRGGGNSDPYTSDGSHITLCSNIRMRGID